MDSAYKLAIEIVADAKNFETNVSKAGDKVDDVVDKTRNAAGENSKFAQSFGVISSGVGKFIAVAGGATGALVFLKNALVSTEGGSDKLEIVTASLKGSYEGLNQAISAGSWETLIQNIVNASKATKDAAISADLLNDILASNTIKKGYLEQERDAARIAAAQSRNAEDKARYIAEAIEAQKQLSQLGIDEINKGIQNTEKYYQARMGWSDREADYNFRKIREMAGNYEYFFGPNSVVAEASKARIEGLKYRESAVGLNSEQKKELQDLQSTVRTMEIYATLQNDISKPDQWNEYVKSIGTLHAAYAQADSDIRRLTESLASQDKIIEKTSNKTRELVPGIGKLSAANISMPRVSVDMSKDLAAGPDNTDAIKKANEELEKQIDLVGGLESTFTSLFVNIDGGFTAMAAAVIDGIKQIAAQLAAKAIVFGIMKMLFPGSALLEGGLKGFLGVGKSLIPGLASGGLAYGPTIAQVGEYPGASTNPEVITPLSKLKGMLGNTAVLPQKARLQVEVGGSMYAYFEYQQRYMNNYK